MKKLDKKISLKFNEDLYEDLRKYGEIEGRSVSNLIRHACQKYVAERKRFERMRTLKEEPARKYLELMSEDLEKELSEYLSKKYGPRLNLTDDETTEEEE